MKCVDCGFLAVDDCEVIREHREILKQGVILAEVPEAGIHIQQRVRCFKCLWSEGRSLGAIVGEVNRERHSCEEFFPYTPGYSPAEHRTLMEKRQDHRREMIIGAIGLVAGTFLTLLTGWVRKRFGF
jgi:hypothetical protein